MNHHINLRINEKEANQNMGQVLIIPIVNLIVLITDIAFNYNSYSITFSQRTYKLLNICPNFFRDGLFEHI